MAVTCETGAESCVQLSSVENSRKSDVVVIMAVRGILATWILCCLMAAGIAECSVRHSSGVKESRVFTAKAAPPLFITWDGDSLDLLLESDQGKRLQAKLGIDAAPVDLHPPSACGADDLCWTFGDSVRLNISASQDGRCYLIDWLSDLDGLKDCYSLSSSHWYGGGEVYDQHWPIDQDSRPEQAYVTGDFFQAGFGGLMEPYWLNSDGFAIHADRDLPLFSSFNDSGDARLCLRSRYAEPYRAPESAALPLRYRICTSSDAKEAHLLAVSSFWSKPRAIPDERMFTHPVWSTWARYKTLINQNRTLNFAAQIRQFGFNDSQLEIDDRWETCYGELQFMSSKFPDPAAMVNQLKAQGFRVTLWIHPFINSQCPSFDTDSVYVVHNSSGEPALTSWWQGSSAGYFDFTRSEAAEWWSARVRRIQADYAIDSFKFDAGETNWLPDDFQLDAIPPSRQPNGYSESYVRNMEQFGPMVEVRTGWNTQDVPIFVRMLDKDSAWTDQNGLLTLIPTLLQFGIEGYPFVLPDMIGGNGYNVLLPDRQLFVRWMQANVFMPALQFSFVPWDYDQEVIDIALKMTSLHAQYADRIVQLARQSTVDGLPINRPVWWIDPLDPVAQTIDSGKISTCVALLGYLLSTGPPMDAKSSSALADCRCNANGPLVAGHCLVHAQGGGSQRYLSNNLCKSDEDLCGGGSWRPKNGRRCGTEAADSTLVAGCHQDECCRRRNGFKKRSLGVKKKKERERERASDFIPLSGWSGIPAPTGEVGKRRSLWAFRRRCRCFHRPLTTPTCISHISRPSNRRHVWPTG